MHTSYVVAALSLILLSGCAQLSEHDRAMLSETRAVTMQARDEAVRAAQDAARSAAEARAASEKAVRAFKHSQKK